MFCNQCGKTIADGSTFCINCGAQLNVSAPTSKAGAPSAGTGEKENLLKSIEQEIAKHPQLAVNRSSQTDLEIKSMLADADWGVGKKKVEYSACLLVKEQDHAVVYWEMIKESGSGMEAGGGFSFGTIKSGKNLFGVKKEVQFSPTGKKVVDYTWDYAKTRKMVEEVVKSCGWQFKTTLMKNKATY